MGGSYYDREVVQVEDNSSSKSSATHSKASEEKLTQRSLHPTLNPFQRAIDCTHQTPIVVAIDVTGSMDYWPKILWDKMPMFFGQIIMQNYVPDPSISFCAIGDSYGDKAPLQICNFENGIALDDWISKIFIEGGGNATEPIPKTVSLACESYELGAYYYTNMCNFTQDTKGYFFFTGDEHFYPTVNGKHVGKLLVGEAIPDQDSFTVFKQLCEKFHVFLIHKFLKWNRPGKEDEKVIANWSRAIGSKHVFVLNEPKAIVDVMLGILAVHSGSRTLDQYLADLVGRGQTEERVEIVTTCLKKLKN